MNDLRLMEKVRLGTPFDVQDAMAIATKIVDPDGKGLNGHNQKTTLALLTGVILHVLYAEQDKTLRGVAAFLDNPDFDKMQSTEHPDVALLAKEMAEKPSNERSGVISMARYDLEQFAA